MRDLRNLFKTLHLFFSFLYHASTVRPSHIERGTRISVPCKTIAFTLVKFSLLENLGVLCPHSNFESYILSSSSGLDVLPVPQQTLPQAVRHHFDNESIYSSLTVCRFPEAKCNLRIKNDTFLFSETKQPSLFGGWRHFEQQLHNQTFIMSPRVMSLIPSTFKVCVHACVRACFCVNFILFCFSFLFCFV